MIFLQKIQIIKRGQAFSKQKVATISLIVAFFIFSFFPYFIFATEKIDINTASLAQLDRLEGIGPTYAQRIIDGRPYSSLDDLLRVKGIGEIILQKIKDQGLACVDCGATQENSGSQNLEPLPSPENPLPSPTPAPSPTKTFQYSQGVLINEFLPYPEKDAKEWVEIVNNGSSAVNLTGWQIDDDNNSTLPQVIPENTTIVPGDFLVISFNKATLNNDGDKVRLLWPDDQVVNTVSFTRATQGQSCARFDAGWFWTNQPTPGQANKKSFYGADETVNTGSSGTSKISTIEEKVAAPSSAPTPQKQNNQNTATTSNSPSPNNNLLTGVGIPNPNLTAAVGSSIKENLTLKTVMSLAAVLLLAGLTAVGLVYFRRLKQVDNENFDD